MKKHYTLFVFILINVTACDKIDQIKITTGPNPTEQTAPKLPPVCDEFLTKSLACMKKNTPSVEMQNELEKEDKIRRAHWAVTPYDQMEKSCTQMLNIYNQQVSKMNC